MTSVFSQLVWTTLIVGPLLYALWVIIGRLLKFRQHVKHFDKFPGFPKHWLYGNLHLYPRPGELGLEKLRGLAACYKDGALRFWFGPVRPTIMIYHPHTMKTLLQTSEPKSFDLGSIYNFLPPWIGGGILIAPSQKWVRNRRLLTPAFHFDILRPYMTVNNRSADTFLNKLQTFSESGEYLELFHHIGLLTLDVLLRCGFSYDNDIQLIGHRHPYVSAVTAIQEAVVYRSVRPWLFPEFIFNLTSVGREFNKKCQFVHGFSSDIISKRRRALQENPDANKSRRYLDFLDVLLTAKDDSGKGMTDNEIRDECDTFLFAGHDTTASGMSWTLYLLAQHPEHQKRCQQEIDEVLGDQPDRDIEWEDLAKLRYLTMCMKEALRLNPPIPYTERETTKDMTLAGRYLPAGSLVSVMIYLLHHNKEVWGDPEEYRPERFSDENNTERDNFAFLPFSAGPRNCIGKHFAVHEMKTVMATILKRYTLIADPDRPARHRDLLVMKPENGMFVTAYVRKP